MGRNSSISIIKQSGVIRKKLKERIKELGLTNGDVYRDANARGLFIDRAGLGRLLNGHQKSIPSEEAILWLCTRYGVSISLSVGFDEYDEEKQINKLKKIFPNKWELKEISDEG